MRAHTLQHVPFEGLGCIEPWLAKKGYDSSFTKFYESSELPPVDSINLLIILGGPMSIHDEVEFPWLVQEKTFIRECIAAGKAVLGICLGAQLIASCLGARVYPNFTKEIGWFPIEGSPTALITSFEFPDTATVLHWHGETFELPQGALHLAKSKATKNQAFQFGPSVIGIQFHLEMTPDSLLSVVSVFEDDLATSQFVQTAKQILSASPETYSESQHHMHGLLDFLHHQANSFRAVVNFPQKALNNEYF